MNHCLENLARHRSKLRKTWELQRTGVFRSEIKQLHLEINRICRKMLRVTTACETARRHSFSPTERGIRLTQNRILKNRVFEKSHLSATKFLCYMETRQSHAANIAHFSIGLPPNFVGRIKAWKFVSHNNRVPGPDGIICELFQLIPNVSSNPICKI